MSARGLMKFFGLGAVFNYESNGGDAARFFMALFLSIQARFVSWSSCFFDDVNEYIGMTRTAGDVFGFY